MRKTAMSDYFLGGEGRLSPSDAAVALITVDKGNYLMQLRDQKPGIFYPGHWGLFGGAVDPGESPEGTLRRELEEELGLQLQQMRYFTEFVFDFSFGGLGRFARKFYEVQIDYAAIGKLVLGEGAAMQVFSAREILTGLRVVPFDSFALWLHAVGTQTFQSDFVAPPIAAGGAKA
jgi:8-oxo-dGTP pyrophosphatase MutT (NUDIX family)